MCFNLMENNILNISAVRSIPLKLTIEELSSNKRQDLVYLLLIILLIVVLLFYFIIRVKFAIKIIIVINLSKHRY